MGMAKEDFEAEQERRRHTGEYCVVCREELTQDDLDYIEKFGGEKLCEVHRKEQENLQKQ